MQLKKTMDEMLTSLDPDINDLITKPTQVYTLYSILIKDNLLIVINNISISILIDFIADA